MTAATGEPPRRGPGRAVVFTGIALGTFVTVTAYVDGYRPPASGLAALLAGVITWVLLAALAVTVLEVLRRHHRAIGRHGWRYGKQGARAAARGAGAAARSAAARSRPWRTRIMAAVRARWAARSIEPLMVRRTAGSRAPGTEDPEPARSPAPVTSPAAPGTAPGAPPPASSSPTGGPMTDTPSPAPGPRGRRRVLTIGGAVPGEWKNLVAITADFEPEDDAALLAWMAGEVNGMSGYAEALTEVYETGVGSVGLDPVSLAALHDTADAAAEAAQAMAAARQKFATHYAEVREFAAAGGLLPFDGRWITGEGE